MEFSEVLARRYSCRQYADRSVERAKLTAVLEAGRLSPSACNSQRWMFVAVDDRAVCGQIAAALVDTALSVNLFAAQIPAYIVLIQHPARHVSPRQQQMLSTVDHSLVDIGIAAQQISLAATNEGLGSVMMGWLREDEIRRALDIPAELKVALVIGIGYPKSEATRHPVRFPKEEVVRWNSYTNREMEK